MARSTVLSGANRLERIIHPSGWIFFTLLQIVYYLTNRFIMGYDGIDLLYVKPRFITFCKRIWHDKF